MGKLDKDILLRAKEEEERRKKEEAAWATDKRKDYVTLPEEPTLDNKLMEGIPKIPQTYGNGESGAEDLPVVPDKTTKPKDFLGAWLWRTNQIDKSYDKRMRELLDEYKSTSSDIDEQEKEDKLRNNIATIIKGLVNASALMYAAKKNIQSDIPLSSPEDKDAVRSIERAMDRKRAQLKDKITDLQALAGSKRTLGLRQADVQKTTGEYAERTSIEDQRRQEAAAEAAAAKEGLQQDKEERLNLQRERLIDSRVREKVRGMQKQFKEGNISGSDMTKDLMQRHGLPEEQAKEISGEVDFWIDGKPDWEAYQEVVRRTTKQQLGATPTGETVPPVGKVMMINDKLGITREVSAEDARKLESLNRGWRRK